MSFPTTTTQDPFTSPWFGELTKSECRQVFGRNKVGRLAFVAGDSVDIVPVHYVFDGEWIYGRTSGGSRLSTIRDGQRVALEIDEHRGTFDWLSAVAYGPFSIFCYTPDDDEESETAWIVRRYFPRAVGGDDPIPFRNQFFRIHASEITGRYAQPSGGRRREPQPSW